MGSDVPPGGGLSAVEIHLTYPLTAAFETRSSAFV